MKTKVLQALEQAEDFLSGQELCERFGVSRTAVWKTIKSLEDDGYKVEAVRNKGYRLLSAPDILTKECCKSRLKTKWVGQYLEAYEEIGSTNQRAKQLGEEGAAHGSVVLADSQSAGRGRRGRSWVTPPHTAIACSILLRPTVALDKISMLTLVVALAVGKAIEDVTGVSAQIKWPNDLVVNRKKVCGILTELSTELDGIHYVVAGIGINVHVTDFPKELQETATSLFIETGIRYNRSELVAALFSAFEEYYEIFEQDGDLGRLKEAYEAKLASMNQVVCILEEGNNRRGICRGISKTGGLLVENEAGQIETIISGEVSVRGIYGYI